MFVVVFFFNDTATTEIYTYVHTLSLHDALPIYRGHVDDRAAAVLQHGRQEGTDHAVHRLHVEVEGEVPILFRAVQDRAVVDIAGDVAQHVERRQLGGQRIHRLGVQHVEPAHGDARRAGQLLQVRDVDVGRQQDRKSVVEGKSVSVRVYTGGRRIIKKKKQTIRII